MSKDKILSSKKENSDNAIDIALRVSNIISNIKFSPYFYAFIENLGDLGYINNEINNNNLVPVEGGFESKNPDGYILGNREVLAAVGCPSLTAESVYEYYHPEDATSSRLKINNEDISLNNYPSRLTVLVGPDKRFEHMRNVFTNIKFQDFVISYRIGPGLSELRTPYKDLNLESQELSEKSGLWQTRVIPLWKIQNRIHYRAEKTRVVVSELFNKEIKVKIIDFVLKIKGKKDIPVLVRYLIVENLSDRLIKDLKIIPLFTNLSKNWAISLKTNPLRLEFSDKEEYLKEGLLNSPNDVEGKHKQAPFFSFLFMGKIDRISFKDMGSTDNLEDLEDLDEYFKEHLQNSEEILSRLGSSSPEYAVNDKSLKDIDTEEELESWKNIGFFAPIVSISESGIIYPNGLKGFGLYYILSSNRAEYYETLGELEKKYNCKLGVKYTSLKIPDTDQLLKDTLKEWMAWFNEVPIEISDPKYFGLIDANLSLLRVLEGKTAINMGTLYYAHNSAFWRDNYWIERALMKAGRYDIVKKDINFFYNAFKKSGFQNSYNINTLAGHIENSREMRMEIPLYPSLMSQMLFKWLRDYKNNDVIHEVEKYYEMIKEGIEESILCPNDLTILLSDETWIWPSYVNEHDYYLDNSLIAIAAYSFGKLLAQKLNKKEDASKSAGKYLRALNGVLNNLILERNYRLAIGVDNNGLKDGSIIPTIYSRPILLELYDDFDEHILKKLNISAKHLFYNAICLSWELIKRMHQIRSHSMTTAIEGNTIGHFLYAVSELDVEFLEEFLEIILNFPNATGSLNEMHDIYNPKWGTEKQRSWDSSSLLEGLLHLFFGVTPALDYFDCNPHLPGDIHSSKISNLRVHDHEIIISCHKHGTNLERSLFMKEIQSKEFEGMGFPIPEVGIIKTNLPGRFRVYDSEILLNKRNADKIYNYYAVTTEIFMPFINTITETEKTPLLSIINPLKTSEQEKSGSSDEVNDSTKSNNDRLYRVIMFSAIHLSNLDISSYNVEFPAHRIKIAFTISGCDANNNTKMIFMKITNGDNITAKLRFFEQKGQGDEGQDESQNEWQIAPNKDFTIEFELPKEKEFGLKILSKTIKDSTKTKGTKKSFTILDTPKDKPAVIYMHTHEHGHDHTHDDHAHPHAHPHTHPHQHISLNYVYKEAPLLHIGPEFKPAAKYPFRNIYDHIPPKKPYWKPHPLILNLDSILFYNLHGDLSSLIILYDEPAKDHAITIYSQIAIIKSKLPAMISINHAYDLIRTANNIPISDSENSRDKMRYVLEYFSYMGKNIILVAENTIVNNWNELGLTELLHQQSNDPSSEFFILTLNKYKYFKDTGKTKLKDKSRMKYIIYNPAKDHVYLDTYLLADTLNTYLIPCRNKAIPMYPYGMMAISDLLGEPITEELPIEISFKRINIDSKELEDSQLSDKKETLMHLYIMGKKYTQNDFHLKDGLYTIRSNIKTTQRIKGFTPEKPYCSIYTINPFAPIEVAAGGLASGKNMFCIKIDAESDENNIYEVNILIKLPQNFNPVHLKGAQRERVLDPTLLIKNPDGSKTLKICIHPGKIVHRYLRSDKVSPTSRKLEYIFGKYPKVPNL
ncbi:MAG: hypothetical protein ACTSXF_15555 [Promethearchaeota archaeon]